MLGVSGAVLASDDIRNRLNQLRLQFFSDNVTIESASESTSEQKGADTNTEEFHVYKWMKMPEGYHIVYEELYEEFELYQVYYENDNGNHIYYSQSPIEDWQTTISYDAQKGYKKIINLEGIDVYSISDGRNNTIFYGRDGYLFEFMSDQPEEKILEYIEMSGILSK